ncbi:MAG: hypothetical protein H6560_09435 [Lewinellaceae bacterium]|nr:hypothetical protein [Lewinellaceae bacterium]
MKKKILLALSLLTTVSLIAIAQLSFGKTFHRVMDRADEAYAQERYRGCRDCEFRFACFDMRPPRKGPHDTWEYSTSCGYDVVQGQWTR